MEKSLRNFFDRFHQILGFDTEILRDEALGKIELVLVARATDRFLKSLSDNERKSYEEFLDNNPGISAERARDFLQTLAPALDMEKLVSEEAAQFIEEYVSYMLKEATEEQKKQVKAAFSEWAAANLSPATS